MRGAQNIGVLSVSIVAICVLAFFILLLVGVNNNYSGVPFWDEWNGSLSFISNLSDKNLGSLFALHNEHRIFLFRLIALFDYYFVGGQIWFLILVNLLIIIGIVHILYKYILLALYSKSIPALSTRLLLVSILFVVETSWMQEQNINWGFQSQFLLAIYLPLVAFYFLQKSWLQDNKNFLHWAIFIGLLSAGSLAIGVSVLPIMFIGALIIKRGRTEILKLGASSILIVIGYLSGYSTPGQHGNPVKSLFLGPVAVIKYFSVYVSGPFIKSFGERNMPFIVCIFAVFILFCVKVFYGILKSRDLTHGNGILFLPTFYFFAFIGITSLGRANFGAREALASRYTSVTLVLYILVLSILVRQYISSGQFNQKYLLFTLFAFVILLLPSQLDALSRNDNAFNQRLSALSLNLGLHDSDQVSRIFPDPNYVFDLAPNIIEANKGIFSDSFFSESRKKTEVNIKKLKATSCEIRIDKVYNSEQEDYFKVFGWSYIKKISRPIGDFIIFNSKGERMGAGISGAIRGDVDAYLGKNNVDAGFAFYTKSKIGKLFIVNAKSGVTCELPNFN